MRVLLIPDKFKGSLTAAEVIQSIQMGIKNAIPLAQIDTVIASDGGDGFLNAMAANVECEAIPTNTVDALGRPIETYYLYDSKKATAYLELAKASGIELLKEHEKCALETSTYGTGLQVRHAIEKGAKIIYLGLGGSATNDGGIGIAKAMGYTFFDGKGNELMPLGKNLGRIAAISKNNEVILDSVSITAINDVDNPLFGQTGAAYTYAGQKGATQEEIRFLDNGLRNLDSVVKSSLQCDVAFVPGAGAAGGSGYGLKAFLNADFMPGIEFILDLTGVELLMKENKYDYIVTGEGKLDDQTLHGKLIKGVVDFGLKYNTALIAVCGKMDMSRRNQEKLGLTKIIEIMDHDRPVQYSIDNAEKLIRNEVYRHFKSLH